MSHEPPVPDANQSPYPLTEQPHPDVATLAALKSGHDVGASSDRNGSADASDEGGAASAIDRVKDSLSGAAERAGELGGAARDRVGDLTRTAGDVVGGSRNLLGIGAAIGAGVLALAGWALASRGGKTSSGSSSARSTTAKRGSGGRAKTASRSPRKAANASAKS